MGEIISGDEEAPEETPATEASEQISEEGEAPEEEEADASGAVDPVDSEEEEVTPDMAITDHTASLTIDADSDALCAAAFTKGVDTSDGNKLTADASTDGIVITVTAKEGVTLSVVTATYKIGSEGTQETVNGTSSDDGWTCTIPANALSDLASNSEAKEVAVTIKATKQEETATEHTVTVKINDEAGVTSVIPVIDGTDGNALAFEGEGDKKAEVKVGKSLALKIEPANGYMVEVTMLDGTEVKDTETPGTYPLGDISADAEVTITATKVYTVATEVKDPEGTVNNELATVTVKDGEGNTVTADDKVKEGTALTVEVTAADADAYEVDTVVYTVGTDTTENPATAAADGKYTIAGNTVIGDVKIIVTMKAVTVEPITDFDGAEAAVKKAVENAAKALKNEDFAEDKLTTATQPTLVSAAEKALADAENFTVALAADGALKVTKEATEEADGEATIGFTITDTTKGEGAQDATRDITVTLVVPKAEALAPAQTLSEAAEAVKTAVEAAEIKAINGINDAENAATLAKVKEDILKAAAEAITNEKISAAIKKAAEGDADEAFVIKEATETDAGSATINLTLTDSTEGADPATQDVQITLVIDKLQAVDPDMTLKTAADLIKAAAEEYGAVSNTDVDTDEKKTAVATGVLEAAKNAKIDWTKFGVDIKKDSKLEVVNATDDNNGMATLVLAVSDLKDDKVEPVEITVTLTVTMPAATKITVNKTNTIEQKVGTRAEYDIEADGALRSSVDISDRSVIASANVSDGKLVVITRAAMADTATLTVSSADGKVSQEVAVTTKDFFDTETTAAPTVAAKNPQGDAALNVTLSSTLADKPVRGTVFYEVTATAKTTENMPEVLRSSVTGYVKRNGESQDYTIEVGSLGNGAKWDYTVTAKLIHSASGDYEDKLSEGKESTGTAISTVSPEDMKFIADLKLKKERIDGGSLYTGRSYGEGVLIATANFSQMSDRYTVIGNAKDSNGGINLKVSGDKIYVTSVDEAALLGKHTITVYAASDRTPSHEAYQARASITVNVVKGINNLTITEPSLSIYKANNKAASLKMGLVYNGDSWNWNGKKYVNAPKSKTVEWTLVNAKTEKAATIDGITVNKKNGTISIAKGYTPNATNNQFKIMVEAKDYEGNDVYDVSETITVTSQETDISQIVITDDDNIVRVVKVTTDRKAVDVKADEIDYGYVYALPATVKVEAGKAFDVSQAFPVENLTFKSSSAKVLSLGDHDEDDNYIPNVIYVMAAGKKVTISVAANDGSKKKSSVTLNLGYSYGGTDNEGLFLNIRNASKNETVCGFDSKWTAVPTAVDAELDTPGVPKLYVNVMIAKKAAAPATGLDYEYAYNTFASYKLSVKGGKIVDQSNGWAAIAANTAKTVITLTDTSVKKGPSYTYTLTNKTYDAAGKAPKVKVKNSLYTYSSQQQTINMSVLDSTNKAFAAGKKVKVDVDWSAQNGKNYYNYYKLSNAFGLFDLGADGSLEMAYDASDYGSLDAGSYKLKVTVGSMQEVKDGELTRTVFVPETKAAAVTLKVVNRKNFTFKPTTTYSISRADGAALLTGKSNLNAKLGEKVVVNSYRLQNVIDKNTGKANQFTHYFTVVQDPSNGSWKLALDMDSEDPVIKDIKDGKKTVADIDKKDLTGYLSYSVRPNVGYYNSSSIPASGTVKITVKAVADPKENKAAKFGSKYKVSAGQVATAADSKVRVNIMVGNEYVNVGYAALDTRKGKKSATELTLLGVNGKGQVVLKANSALTDKRSYTVNLQIVPTSSWYLNEIIKETDETKRADLLAKYGVAVKVSIKAMTSPVAAADPTESKQNDVYAAASAVENVVSRHVKVYTTDTDAAAVTAKILAAAEAALDDNYTVAVATDGALKLEGGKATITLQITDTTKAADELGYSTKLPLEFTAEEAPAVPAATLEAAASAVEAAVKTAEIKVTNDDVKDANAKKAVAKQILDAAKTASIDTKFTVAIKQTTAGTDDELAVTPAESAEKNGTAKITLVVTDTTADAKDNTKEVEITLVVTFPGTEPPVTEDTYDVATKIQDNGVDQTGDDAKALAEITEPTGIVDGKTVKDTDITFKVTPGTGADGKDIKVSYVIGDGEATPLTAVNDVYTIEATKITGAVTIIVNVVTKEENPDPETIEVTITDSTDGNATIQSAVSTEANASNLTWSAIGEAGKVSVTSGSYLFLQVEPKAGYEATVTVDGESEALTGTDNVYSIGKIDAAKTVTVAAAVTKYTLTFKFGANDDIAADIQKVEALASESDPEAGAAYKDVTSEKKFEVEAGKKLYLKVTLASGKTLDKVMVGTTEMSMTKDDGSDYYSGSLAISEASAVTITLSATE